MSELAVKPMTLDEFLRWDDGTETHYELIGGFPVAMAPPAEAHRILAVRRNRIMSMAEARLGGAHHTRGAAGFRQSWQEPADPGLA